MLNVSNASLKYIWREPSQYVGFLANEKHKHDEDLIMWENALKDMKFLLLTNLNDVAFGRTIFSKAF